MTYPTEAEVNGKIYPINTDLQTAKECFRVINDETIDGYERTLAVVYLIFGFVPFENCDLFLEKATKFLQCGQENSDNSEPPDMDINYDEGYIVSSFMADYRVDLSVENMHYWKFMDLLQGLSENCVMSRVRKIRNYNLDEVKDPEQRAKIIELQEQLKLPEHISPEEQEKIDYLESFFN